MTKATHTLGFDLHVGSDYVAVLEAGGTTDDLVARVYGDDDATTISRGQMFAAAPQMLAVLKKWDAFMRANYKPQDISWWKDHVAALATAGLK